MSWSSSTTGKNFSPIDISTLEEVSSTLVAYLFAVSQGANQFILLKELFSADQQPCLGNINKLIGQGYIYVSGDVYEVTQAGYRILAAMGAASSIELED